MIDSVLHLAAVFGAEFDIGTVVLAASLPPPVFDRAEVFHALTAAAGGVLVQVERSANRYRFVDDALAAEYVTALAAPVLLDCRRRAAIALERAGADPVVVARQWLRAAILDPAAAVAAGRRGAASALHRGSPEDACELFELTLDAQLLDPAFAADARAELLVSLGEARAAAGRRDDALTSFEAALAIDLPPTRRAEVAARTITSYSEWPAQPTRDVADAATERLAASALAALGEDDSAARSIALARLGQTARWSVDLERGAGLVEEAAAIAERLGDATAKAVATLARRLVTVAPDAADERLTLSAAAVALTRQAARRDLPLALMLHAADQLEAGSLGAATATSSELADEAERGGEPGPWHLARRVEAALALLAGRLDRAEELADDALRHGIRAQHHRAAVNHDLQLLHCRIPVDGSVELLEPWQARADTSLWHRATFGWAAAMVGETGTALDVTTDVLALDLTAQRRNAGWLPLLVTVADAVAEIALRDGELASAVVDLRGLVDGHHRRIVTAFNGVVCLGSMEHAAGRLALAAGDQPNAERHLRAAVAAHDRLGAVLLAAASRADLAAVLRRRHDPAAGALLDQAVQACRSRGAIALERRLAGPSATAADPASDTGLSPREIDVLRHLAAGRTNKEIGALLHISAATVQRHTINLYRKIGASGRSEAAVYAVQNGIID